MTKKELEQELEQLRERVRQLEAKPTFVPLPYPVYPYASPYPHFPSYPNIVYMSGTATAIGYAAS